MYKLQTFISNVLIDQLGTAISQFSAFLALIGDRLVSLMQHAHCGAGKWLHSHSNRLLE